MTTLAVETKQGQWANGPNTDGGNLCGTKSTSKVGFYGTVPIVQRTSTVLASALLSASSYVSIASNTAAIVSELAAALVALGLIKTA